MDTGSTSSGDTGCSHKFPPAQSSAEDYPLPYQFTFHLFLSQLYCLSICCSLSICYPSYLYEKTRHLFIWYVLFSAVLFRFPYDLHVIPCALVLWCFNCWHVAFVIPCFCSKAKWSDRCFSHQVCWPLLGCYCLRLFLLAFYIWGSRGVCLCASGFLFHVLVLPDDSWFSTHMTKNAREWRLWAFMVIDQGCLVYDPRPGDGVSVCWVVHSHFVVVWSEWRRSCLIVGEYRLCTAMLTLFWFRLSGGAYRWRRRWQGETVIWLSGAEASWHLGRVLIGGGDLEAFAGEGYIFLGACIS